MNHLPQRDRSVVAGSPVLSAPVETFTVLRQVLGDRQNRVGKTFREGSLKLLLHLVGCEGERERERRELPLDSGKLQFVGVTKGSFHHRAIAPEVPQVAIGMKAKV